MQQNAIPRQVQQQIYAQIDLFFSLRGAVSGVTEDVLCTATLSKPAGSRVTTNLSEPSSTSPIRDAVRHWFL